MISLMELESCTSKMGHIIMVHLHTGLLMEMADIFSAKVVIMKVK